MSAAPEPTQKRRRAPIFWVVLACAIAAGVYGGATALASSSEGRGDRRGADPFTVHIVGANPLPAMTAGAVSEAALQADITKRARDLLETGRFDDLELMARRFRTTDKLTPAGNWKLDIFYSAFCDCGQALAETTPRAEQAVAFQAAYPDSPTPLLIRAEMLLDEAWKMRNGYVAHEVTQQDWTVFYAKLNEAQDLLNEHIEAVGDDPQLFTIRAELARASSIDQAGFAVLLDQGIASNASYLPLYNAAVETSVPIWRNDPALIETLARRAVSETERVGGRTLYARVYLQAWSLGLEKMYATSRVDRGYLHEAIGDLLKQYPDRSNFELVARMACDQQDWGLAAALIDRLQDQPASTYAWPAPGTYNECRASLHNAFLPQAE